MAVSAQGFRRGANQVRKRMWWKDVKMRLLIVLAIIILLCVIIIPAAVTTTDKNDDKNTNNNKTASDNVTRSGSAENAQATSH